jgi:hypothetical protein
MYHPKFSWNDYFTATPVTTIGPSSYNYRRTPSDSNVYVLHCLFNAITSTGDGGALYCTSNYLLVESSSFFSCRTSSNNYGGGAICFDNTGSGECALHGVCGYDCNTTSGRAYSQFSRLRVRNTASNRNYVNYTSASRCVNEMSDTYKMLRLEYGKQCCQSTNLSMNKCYYRSGVYCYPFNDPNSVTCSLLYSTFADSHAVGNTCIRFNNRPAKCEIKCCNIIRNTQDNPSATGTIYSSGNLVTIKDSCILENTADTIFYSSSSSYPFTLSNCTVDKTTNNECLTTQSTVTKSFILALHHMSTRNCHSEYDSAGTITIIPNVSHLTIKVISCYYQARISDFISFNCLFMFTFIHPNPSIYYL